MPPKKAIDTQARHWCFTLNNPDGDDITRLTRAAGMGQFKYWAWQLEKGKREETTHIQGYIGLARRTRFSSVKAMLPGNPHLEMAVDAAASYRYCQKDDSYVAGGLREASHDTPPGPTEQLKGNVWQKYQSDCNSGRTYMELCEMYPHLRSQEGAMRKIYEDHLYKERVTLKDMKAIEVETYWGPPGIGKSLTVRDILETKHKDEPFYRQHDGKWFDGYNYEKNLWIDDMGPGRFTRAAFMQLLDRGTVRVEVKGGHALAKFERIFITTNFDPRDWFYKEERKFLKSDEIGAATMRRMSVFKIECDENDPSQVKIVPETRQQQGNTIPAVAQATLTALLKARKQETDDPKKDASPKGDPSETLPGSSVVENVGDDTDTDDDEVQSPIGGDFKRRLLEQSGSTAVYYPTFEEFVQMKKHDYYSHNP